MKNAEYNMYQAIKFAHPILAGLLIAGYLFLMFRLRHKNEDLQPFEVAVAQAVRIMLLLLYFTGLFLTINMRLYVNRTHHYASLIPVVVIFAFQFLPTIRKKSLSTKDYFYLFTALLIAVVVIALTAKIF
jgi:FtsH-binding integral membrane protein